MKQYILESSKKSKRRQQHFVIFGDVDVFVKDPLPEDVELDQVLRDLERIIPKNFTRNLDIIYVGDFDHLRDRDVNAMYDSGAIYITNEQDDNVDILDDLIHEIAHAVEENYNQEIYGDDKIRGEFLAKRNTLRRILGAHGYDVRSHNLLDVEYSRGLDEFFYEDVGYAKLSNFVLGLFISPYPVTSLREYFASGFEEYYLGDRRALAEISPKLYNKLNELNKTEEENEARKF